MNQYSQLAFKFIEISEVYPFLILLWLVQIFFTAETLIFFCSEFNNATLMPMCSGGPGSRRIEESVSNNQRRRQKKTLSS